MSLLSKIVFLVAFIAASSPSQVQVEGRGATRRFISQKYGFSMAVPKGWGVSTGLDTPVFFYAPPSERFVQAAIPQGGAVITTNAQDMASRKETSATTPEAWALADARAVASSSPPIEPFKFPRESRISRAVTCSFDEVTLSQEQRTQHSVAIFWKFDQELFAAHLNYNANDPQGSTFERVFFQTIRSIRPLNNH